jgi:hypothetical protein
MSTLESSKPVSLNFSNGFTLFASITIRPQKQKGRKVIFQIAHITPPLLITLGLDNNNYLRVWLVDTQGHSFKSKPVDKKRFFQKSVFLHCSVIPGKNNRELPKLELGVDDYVDQTEIDANLGSEENVVYSIGGNLNGKENAAFDMAALSLYNIVLSPDQIRAISNSLIQELGRIR